MRTLRSLLVAAMLPVAAGMYAQYTPVSQMERLDRGVIAVLGQSNKGNFVSWRLFGTDDINRTTFNVLRNGKLAKSGLTVNCFVDASGTQNTEYQVVTLVDGVAQDTSKVAKAWGQPYLKLPLDRPATGAQGGTYSPNDCSVGDVDGDGEYELFVKWDPSTSKDNSQSGVTDNVYIDCYKLDGTKLWRIDLGRNIRAGAHYTQFQVYDYDGDGRAELMCKTAPGSKDGQGNYVSEAATDAAIKAVNNTKSHVASGGRINSGHEYLTVFNGQTGAAIHTIAYFPNRNAKAELSEAAGTYNWDDRSGKSDTGSYGNRGERFLAATAYLDGPDQRPSGIFTRGYYTYAYVWAVDFDGQHLSSKWLHRSDSKTSYSVVTFDQDGKSTSKTFNGLKPTSGSGSATMYSNGNHNMSVGDVDGDGCDEIIWGSAALDNDGKLLYGTGFGHGDAIHLGTMIPGRKGMQVFQVHEEKGTYAWDLHDAATGEIIYKGGPSGVDNGRGMAAQLSASSKEWWFSSASERQQRSAATGEVASTGQTSVNFRVYWNSSLQDQLLDGNKIDYYNDASKGTSRLVNLYDVGPGSTCNSTKNTPNLSADIFGDWREEVVLYTVTDDEAYLGIHSTNYENFYPVPTLMHDHTYRMGICWQNTAYNQPPHLGYNLALEMAPHLADDSREFTVPLGEEMQIAVNLKYVKSVSIAASYLPDGTRKVAMLPTGFKRTNNYKEQTVTITGTPSQEGQYVIALKLTDLAGSSEKPVDTLRINVVNTTGITYHPSSATHHPSAAIHDLSGKRLPYSSLDHAPRGLYIVEERTAEGIVRRKVVK